MLCVTGNEPTFAQLQQRLKSALREAPHALQEVRLDALKEPLGDVKQVLAPFSTALIVCYRPERQGGSYRGDEHERLAVLRDMAQAGAAYIDLEGDLSEDDIRSISRAGGSKIILSWHDFSAFSADATRRFRMLVERRPHVAKLAVAIDRPRQLLTLRDLQGSGTLGRVLIGMGEAGVLSRTRYPAFASMWTYVAAEESRETAPGQLTLSSALQQGLPKSASRPFLALVGGAQVRHSAGPVVYNRLFAKRDWPLSYQALATSHPVDTFQVLQEFGAVGASVTMPHKREAALFAVADEWVSQTGGANSLRFKNDLVEATNTDVDGVREPLQKAITDLRLQTVPTRALILGSGGAARAAVVACRALGFGVTVAARRIEQARALLGSGDGVVPWKERHQLVADILINATPLSGAHVLPWPDETPIAKRIVFDIAITGQPSLLLERAAEEGAIVIPAREMWLAQGARQLSWITGEPWTTDALREQLPDSWK